MADTHGVRDVAALPAFRARRGLDGLLVSDGPRALHCITAGGHWVATPPPVTEVNAVGSGDALTGAFAFVLDRGGSIEEALRAGAAAGAANAEQLLVCEFEPARWRELAARVILRRVA
jgi:fructose-1-phosphate kinase PfkB-like protein